MKNPFKKQAAEKLDLSTSSAGMSSGVEKPLPDEIVDLQGRINELEQDNIELHKQLNRIERRLQRQALDNGGIIDNKDDNSWLKGLR